MSIRFRLSQVISKHTHTHRRKRNCQTPYQTHADRSATDRCISLPTILIAVVLKQKERKKFFLFFVDAREGSKAKKKWGKMLSEHDIRRMSVISVWLCYLQRE